jgi:hypothetical protein
LKPAATLRAVLPPLMIACLLQACAGTPAAPERAEWKVTPLFELRDARGGTPPPVAPEPAPVAASLTRPQARMEVVKIAPNEYLLQEIREQADPVAVSGDERHETKLQIINGNGRRGQARQIKHIVDRLGIGSATLLNQRHYRQRITVIEYLADRENEARAIAALLPARIVLRAIVRLPGQTRIRLVLGHDLTAGVSPALIAAAP